MRCQIINTQIQILIFTQFFKKNPKMRKVDPLDLLKSAYNKNIQKKSTIKLKGTDLYFDREIRLPITTQTAWQSTQTGKQFNLGSLWMILELHFQRIPNKSQYFKQVSLLKLDPVGVADAEEIFKYFSGQTNTSACINNELKQALSQKTKGRDQSAVGVAEGEDKIEKKIKTETKYDEQTTNLLKCLDYLKAYEIHTNSKTKSITYPKDFYNILADMKQKYKAADKPQVVENNNKQGTCKLQQIVDRKKYPTIIVPEKTIPGNVSIENIQKFLVKGQYDEKAKLANPQVSKIQIQKYFRNRKFLFDVYCRPELLSEKDWQNVVAVFVIGKDNQFDQWPCKNHKKAFETSLGFFVKFPKTHPGSTSHWNCRVLALDPISRIGDKEIVKVIWDDIQKFIFAKI